MKRKEREKREGYGHHFNANSIRTKRKNDGWKRKRDKNREAERKKITRKEETIKKRKTET